VFGGIAESKKAEELKLLEKALTTGDVWHGLVFKKTEDKRVKFEGRLMIELTLFLAGDLKKLFHEQLRSV